MHIANMLTTNRITHTLAKVEKLSCKDFIKFIVTFANQFICFH